MRLALGASRGRIARQMLVESLMLATVVELLGLALAGCRHQSLVAIAPSDLPRLSDVRIDVSVIAFALLATLGRRCSSASSRRCTAARSDLRDAARRIARLTRTTIDSTLATRVGRHRDRARDRAAHGRGPSAEKHRATARRRPRLSREGRVHVQHWSTSAAIRDARGRDRAHDHVAGSHSARPRRERRRRLVQPSARRQRSAIHVHDPRQTRNRRAQRAAGAGSLRRPSVFRDDGNSARSRPAVQRRRPRRHRRVASVDRQRGARASLFPERRSDRKDIETGWGGPGWPGKSSAARSLALLETFDSARSTASDAAHVHAVRAMAGERVQCRHPLDRQLPSGRIRRRALDSAGARFATSQ